MTGSAKSAARRSGRNAPVGPRTGPAVAAADAALSPWIVVLMIVLVLMPIELSLQLGDLFIPWYRAVLLIATIPVMLRAATGGMQFQNYDKLIVGLAFWAFATEIMKRGGAGLQPAGSTFAETLTAYLLVRIHIRTKEQIIRFCRLMFALMIVPVALSVPEALMHQRFIHDFARSISGYVYRHADDIRFGMLRAESFFQHPILFGLFCSSFFSLSWATARSASGRWLRPIWLSLGVVMSISSSAVLTVLIQIALMVGERMSRGVKKRMPILMWSIGGLFLFLTVASNRGPFAIIANTLAFNGGSAYFRILQWDLGIDDVMRSPIIGIKPETWTRPFWMGSSVDNNWLLMMMKVGIPGLMVMSLIMYLLWRAVYYRKTEDVELKLISRAWLFTLVTLVLTGATVAFFGKVMTMFYILLALGGSLALCHGDAPPDERDKNAGRAADKNVAGDRQERRRRAAGTFRPEGADPASGAPSPKPSRFFGGTGRVR